MNSTDFKKHYDNWVVFVRACLKGWPNNPRDVGYLIGYGHALSHFAVTSLPISLGNRYVGWILHWIRCLADRFSVNPLRICSYWEVGYF